MGRRAQRKRERKRAEREDLLEAAGEAMRAAGYDSGLAQHMLDNQVAPQMIASDARKAGLSVGTGFVSTNLGADGVMVQCVHCGRQAKMLQAPPQDAVVVCPPCARRLG